MRKICHKCLIEDDELRTLWMACSYEMKELGIPFESETLADGGINDGHPVNHYNFYQLEVCKDCRSDWMHAIKNWFNWPRVNPESCGSGIYVRDFGANREITREEWEKRSREKND